MFQWLEANSEGQGRDIRRQRKTRGTGVNVEEIKDRKGRVGLFGRRQDAKGRQEGWMDRQK